MAVIRPYSPPVITPTSKPAQAPVQTRGAAEARAAQRAFFQQALGDSTPVRAAPVASAPVRASATPSVQSSAQPSGQSVQGIRRPIPDEPPTRIMRPGSFIDLKV